METLPGRQEPDGHATSLDNEFTSARQRYRRMFHRVMSGLEKDGNVRLLTLTSSPTSGDFQRDFRMLIKRLQRRGLVESYIRVPEKTKTGLRHDHIVFRGSYIDQQYLSSLWGNIHHSPVVDIRRCGNHRGIARYLANYLAKSPAARYSYSWGWVWRGFAKSWKGLKGFGQEMGWPFSRVLTTWHFCVKLNIKPEEMIPI